ncbi:MAG: hypothetical protein ACLR9W_06470, partial [Enterobacter hormaechei]
AMQTTATFDHSTITGDILFSSTFDNNFYENGDPATDTTEDGVYNPTTNGWDGTDKLDVTLTNGSKWVGAAQSSVEAIGTAQMYGQGYSNVDWHALAPNSIWPDPPLTATPRSGRSGHQSGLFNVTLDNGSSGIPVRSLTSTLAVNNRSQVNVENAGLLATNPNQCFIAEYWRQRRRSDRQPLSDSDSRAALTEETAALYAIRSPSITVPSWRWVWVRSTRTIWC